VVAFGVEADAAEQVVVVAEWRGADPGAARTAIARTLTRELGIAPADVVLVEPRTVPKTSSGKLMRGATREAYLAGRLAV
jgi:acyl-CoA synthetase (AMP-forming)/AMP-acid ligase II